MLRDPRRGKIMLYALIGMFALLKTHLCYAAAFSLEKQVLQVIVEEAAHGQIRAGVAGFVYAPGSLSPKMTKEQLKTAEDAATQRFIASLLQEIRRSGYHDQVSIIEREQLDAILREKRLQVTGLTEQTVSSIGGLAGLDVILLGTLRGQSAQTSLTIKVIRVADGELLGIAEKASEQNKLVNVVTDLKAHSWNSLAINLRESGTVTVVVQVIRGNPVNVSVMNSLDFEKFKKEKKHGYLSEFEANKTRMYSRSAYLAEGEYYLVLEDKAHGVVSMPRSDIRVTAYREPD